MAKIPPKSKAAPAPSRIKEPSNIPAKAEEAPDDLTELLISGLRELYWAEKHLVLNLPKVQEAAGNTPLAKAVSQHWKVTKGHVARLEQAFGLLGVDPIAAKCDGMEGLVMEGEGIIDATKPGSKARLTGLIMGCQKVETYEITAYTGLSLLATKLGLAEVAGLLDATRAEEQESDNILSQLADTQ